MTVEAGAGGASGFPEATFTIEDDPAALRASLAPYRAFAARAREAEKVLAGTTATSWAGAEGDLFRTRRAQYKPMLTSGAEAFDRAARAGDDFATTVEGLVRSMDALRSRARTVWTQLQAARATAATAATQLAAAAVSVASAPADPVAAAAAATGLASAQQAAADASAQVADLEHQWQECLDEAATLHENLRTAAEETATLIRGLPAPPTVPPPATGGASPGTLDAFGDGPLLGGAPGLLPTTGPGTPLPATAPGLGDRYHDRLQYEDAQFLLNLSTVRTGLVTSPNAANLWSEVRGSKTVPFPYTLEALGKSHSKQAVEAKARELAPPREWAREAASKISALSTYEEMGGTLTRTDQAGLTFLRNQMPSLQEAADAAKAKAAHVAHLGKGFRGANYGLGALNLAGDLDIMIHPPDEGAVGVLDRTAAGLNAAGTVVGIVDLAAPSLLATTAVPVVGEVVVLATGAYLTANWAYHKSDTVKNAWNSTMDAGGKALHGDFSGAREALAKEADRLGHDLATDGTHLRDYLTHAADGAWSTVKGLF